MKIVPTLEIRNKGWSSDLSSFAQMVRKIYEALARVINGQLSFGNSTSLDNISGYWFSGTTPGTPGTDFTLVHNLGRVPVGYLVFAKGASVDIYTGSVSATSTNITLQATVGNVLVTIFVT
jgi:hypothetical protein